MFISLTDADNGQAVELRADMIGVIRVLDSTRTQIRVAGDEVEVRESPRRVKEAIATVLGLGIAHERATTYEGGKW